MSIVTKRPFCETARPMLRLHVMLWKWRNGFKDCISITPEHEHWHLQKQEQ